MLRSLPITMLTIFFFSQKYIGKDVLIDSRMTMLEPRPVPRETVLLCKIKFIHLKVECGKSKSRRIRSKTDKIYDFFYFSAVLRSRQYFGRLRLRKSEVPELTPAPTKLGRLRLHAKKGGSRRLRLHTLTVFILSS